MALKIIKFITRSVFLIITMVHFQSVCFANSEKNHTSVLDSDFFYDGKLVTQSIHLSLKNSNYTITIAAPYLCEDKVSASFAFSEQKHQMYNVKSYISNLNGIIGLHMSQKLHYNCRTLKYRSKRLSRALCHIEIDLEIKEPIDGILNVEYKLKHDKLVRPSDINVCIFREPF